MTLTKIKFPTVGFPREQARQSLHLFATNLIAVNVVVVAVAEEPQIVCLVSPLDLAKGMCG